MATCKTTFLSLMCQTITGVWTLLEWNYTFWHTNRGMSERTERFTSALYIRITWEHLCVLTIIHKKGCPLSEISKTEYSEIFKKASHYIECDIFFSQLGEIFKKDLLLSALLIRKLVSFKKNKNKLRNI